MTASLRSYHKAPDFKSIGDFLVAQHRPGNRDGNWLQPTWEYMHSHPALDETALGRIGVWEEAGEIVGAAHYESTLGEAFFEIHPRYTDLKPEMLGYAEAHLYATGADGKHSLRAYINDFDPEFTGLARQRGCQRAAAEDRPMSMMTLLPPLPAIRLPNGFCLKSLQDEDDLYKISRVLWRGFNHPGEPPATEAELAGRRKMQSGPNFRRDLNIVVVAPDGNYVAYSGTWFDPVHRLAYIEPVATDPAFRRRGLGAVAVLEGLRRCAAEGATTAYVGSDQAFYHALGFQKIFTSCCWIKTWE